MVEDKFIDIEKLIAERNPKLLKRMPKFLLNFFKRILHEEEVNDFISKHKDVYDADFCDAVVDYFDISMNVVGKERIPEDGGCIFAVNHPLGGMDAIAIVSAMRDVREDIKFIVNDVLMNLDNLKNMFVGVNKLGKNLTESLRKVDATFNTDQAVFVFPAGLVSRKQKGRVEDLEWKKTFVTRARKYNQPILPVYIDGKLSNFFYNLANLRALLGIKVNIEMFFLVNELYKQKGRSIDLVFGNLIMPDHIQNSDLSDREWAQEIKNRVYQLKGQRH